MMIGDRFPLNDDLDFVEAGKALLRADFIYLSVLYGEIRAKKGYITDGASIPKFLWSIIGSPWVGKYLFIAIIHDWLCSTEGMVLATGEKLTKKQTDQVFLEGMKYSKVNFFKRHVMHKAVRMFRLKFDWEKKEKNK